MLGGFCMLRNKKIVIISHCILNQNSVVCPLARSQGAFKFVKGIIDEGVGIIQLPCPELRHLGISRKSMEKSEYDTKEYRTLCKSLVMPYIDEIKLYMDNGYQILGIIGINESPTCSITKNRGIMMEEFFKLLDKRQIDLDVMEVPSSYNDEKDFEKVFIDFKKTLL